MMKRPSLAILLLPALLTTHPAHPQNQSRAGVFAAELRIFLVARMTPLLKRTPEKLSRDAFTSEYGRAVVAETADILRTSADPGCLRSKPLGAEDVVKSARELLVSYGTSLILRYRDAADAKTFDEAFAAKAGAGWNLDIERLRNDPDVRKYLELREPLLLASVVEDTTEILDRHARGERIELSGSLYPLMSSSERVQRAIPYDKHGDALSDFLKNRKSPGIERWDGIEQAASDAWLQAVSDSQLRALLRPRELVPDFGARLRALCVYKR